MLSFSFVKVLSCKVTGEWSVQETILTFWQIGNPCALIELHLPSWTQVHSLNYIYHHELTYTRWITMTIDVCHIVCILVGVTLSVGGAVVTAAVGATVGAIVGSMWCTLSTLSCALQLVHKKCIKEPVCPRNCWLVRSCLVKGTD